MTNHTPHSVGGGAFPELYFTRPLPPGAGDGAGDREEEEEEEEVWMVIGFAAAEAGKRMSGLSDEQVVAEAVGQVRQSKT